MSCFSTEPCAPFRGPKIQRQLLRGVGWGGVNASRGEGHCHPSSSLLTSNLSKSDQLPTMHYSPSTDNRDSSQTSFFVWSTVSHFSRGFINKGGGVDRCRVNSAHIRQSRPHSGLGLSHFSGGNLLNISEYFCFARKRRGGGVSLGEGLDFVLVVTLHLLRRVNRARKRILQVTGLTVDREKEIYIYI